jgi:hypothetical protein
MIDGDGARFAAVVAGQLAWLTIVAALALAVCRRATSRLVRSGG